MSLRVPTIHDLINQSINQKIQNYLLKVYEIDPFVYVLVCDLMWNDLSST